MPKVLSLICPTCGKNANFNLGAGESLAAMHDVAAMVSDVEEVLINVMNVETLFNNEQLLFFSQNLAYSLENIDYSLFPLKINLFDKAVLEASNIPAIDGRVAEANEISKAKWKSILQKYGVVAFNAIYICEKCGKLHNNPYFQIKYILDKKEKMFILSQKCNCGNTLSIVDDGNAGFCHIGLQTNLPCECGTKFNVDKVIFNKTV